jgi:hypothetical protein
MNRRTLAVVAVAALMTASAHGADPARTPQAALPQLEERALDLRALFDRAPGVISNDANGITVGAFAVDVIVARVDTDGKLVTACVATEEAAKRFLTAPIEKVDGRAVKEQ